jgi:hypothetical protein
VQRQHQPVGFFKVIFSTLAGSSNFRHRSVRSLYFVFLNFFYLLTSFIFSISVSLLQAPLGMLTFMKKLDFETME